MNTLQELFSEEGLQFSDFAIEFRLHATKRMFERDIQQKDVNYTLQHGNIIEKYEDDFPLPSVLINGKMRNNRPLHVVVGLNKIELVLVIITTYEPHPEKWSEDYSRRVG